MNPDEFVPIVPDPEPFDPIIPDPEPDEIRDGADDAGYGPTPDMTAGASDG